MQKPRCHGPDLLRARIDVLGWSQSEFARRLGVTTGVVSRWLSGERGPKLGMAIRVQRLVGIPVEAWVPIEPRATGTGC